MGIHIMTPLYMAAKPPPLPPVTVTFYPDPDPEVTSCDGYAGRRILAPPYTWDDLRNGPGTEGRANEAHFTIWLEGLKAADETWKSMYRDFLLFDTSIIGPGATTISAYLKVWCDYTYWDAYHADATICLVGSHPVYDTDIIAVDFQNIGAALLSNTQPLANDLVVDDWNTFTLNATGLAAINKTGISKFGLREGTWDRPDIEPPPSSRSQSSRFHSADNLSGNKPELVVTYQP